MLEELKEQTVHISKTLTRQGVSQVVHTFDVNSKQIKEWSKRIDVHIAVLGLPVEKKIVFLINMHRTCQWFYRKLYKSTSF